MQQTYLSVADPSTGRYIILMEYLENFTPLDEILRETNADKFKEMTGTTDPLYGSPDETFSLIVKQVAYQLSFVHGTFWKDRDQLVRGK